jgi:hypothetical protein
MGHAAWQVLRRRGGLYDGDRGRGYSMRYEIVCREFSKNFRHAKFFSGIILPRFFLKNFRKYLVPFFLKKFRKIREMKKIRIKNFSWTLKKTSTRQGPSGFSGFPFMAIALIVEGCVILIGSAC